MADATSGTSSTTGDADEEQDEAEEHEDRAEVVQLPAEGAEVDGLLGGGDEGEEGEAVAGDVVTFNGDGVNDFYKAIRVKHIKDIVLYIYNRWGQLIYETKDPYFNWEGKVLQTKMLASDGTYFYTCVVNELRVKPTKPRFLKGYIQVFKE